MAAGAAVVGGGEPVPAKLRDAYRPRPVTGTGNSPRPGSLERRWSHLEGPSLCQLFTLCTLIQPTLSRILSNVTDTDLELRARRHGALSEPARLSIIDELTVSDRAPIELREQIGIPSNLLAHHLDVLESVGLIGRTKSSGDGRRRYVHLRHEALTDLAPRRRLPLGPALFVCTANSARSQLAAALWESIVQSPATSAGTRPAPKVNPGAVAAARRAGLDLSTATPQTLDDVDIAAGLVITVCDRAHEELGDHPEWLHWSIPDPVPLNTRAAFDRAVNELRGRIDSLRDDSLVA